MGDVMTQMNNSLFSYKPVALCVIAALTGTAYAAEDATEQSVERISVIGSHIKTDHDTGQLPVSVMSAEDIENTGAITGAELLAEIPQIGEVNFSSERVVGGVNDARGDVSSINLRGIGTGNTLTLLNGRRLVLHPGTQSENLVPVTTVNSNTLPVKGLKRLEVLRDGAAAIYGSDAVAGVINYVLKDDYEGSEVSLNYGTSEGTSLDQLTLSGVTGFSFNDNKSHLTLSGAFYNRDGMPASERDYAASQDRREASGLPEDFIGDTQLDNRSTSTPWGEFSSSSLGTFHIQPGTDSGCVQDLGNGICADQGSLSRDLRYDAAPDQSLTSDIQRINAYALYTQDLGNDLELFAEGIYYSADADRTRERRHNLTAQRFTVAADAFYNPFGEQVTVRRYKPVDAGLRNIDVEDTSYRALIGLRGFTGDWDWETAALYSEAKTEDITNRVITSDFQAAVNSTDQATAYDIFNGGDLNNPNNGDATANSQSVIDSFIQNVVRESETSLALVDFKISTGALFELPAGDVGFASGVEWRRETFSDVRSDLLNGNTPFVDQNTGAVLSNSDVLGSSPTPDADGSRNVFSAYAEFAIPLLSELPAVQSLDMQLAARYEDFNDVGDVLKPKVAFSWVPMDGLQFRASYAEGFRAPGLPQVVAKDIARSNTRSDPVADARYGVLEIRNGSDTLKPEEDVNKSFGVVIEPSDTLTFTADWWQVKQEDLVGILNSQTHLLYDSLLRSQGSSNPFVIRNDDLEVVQVNNDYTNLAPREIEGLDFSLTYELDTEVGAFKFKINAAKLLTFEQGVDEITATVLAAQEAGNPAVQYRGDNLAIPGAGDLIQQNGRPEWRTNASLGWRNDQWGAGIKGKYVSDFFDTSTSYTDDQGETVTLPVDSYFTADVYANYRFAQGGALDGTKVTFGVRNIADKEPPVADESFGYFSSVHSNRGRYFYMNLTKTF